MEQGIILYGPPASGKDTITRELGRIDASIYVPFRRIKIGGTVKDQYRTGTLRQLRELENDGGILWMNRAYEATYIVDRDGLGLALSRSVPVVHLGQPEGVTAVCQATGGTLWTVVELWCSRESATARMTARGDAVPERLAVWDATPRLTGAALSIDTDVRSPHDAAWSIHEAVLRSRERARGVPRVPAVPETP